MAIVSKSKTKVFVDADKDKKYDLWLNIGIEHKGQLITLTKGISLDDIVEHTEAVCNDLNIRNGMRTAKIALANKIYDLATNTNGRQRIKLVCELYNKASMESPEDAVPEFDIELVD